MGAGGSTGGGSSNGSIDYPDYMESMHENFLNAAWTIVQSEIGSASPYSGYSTVDPNFTFGVGGGWYSPVSAMNAIKDLNLASQFNSIASAVNSFSDNISAEVASHSAVLATRLINEIYPRFEAGMSDIGAVCSSAFAIGRSILEDSHTKMVTDFEQKERHKKLEFSWNVALQLTLAHLDKLRLVANLAAEIARLYTAARYEVDVSTINMAARDRWWDLETVERAGNILASISGGTVARNETAHASGLGGALSGALSGAAMGAMAGSAIPGIGTGIGAAIGGGLGLLAGLF